MKKKISMLCDQVFEYCEEHRTFENWYVAIGTFLSLAIVAAVIFFNLSLPMWALVYPFYKTVTFFIFGVSLFFRKKDYSTFDACTIPSLLSELDALIIMKTHHLFKR